MLRQQPMLQMSDGAIEARLVASVLDPRAGVTHARAVAREGRAASREARAEDDVLQIDREMPRVGDGRAATAGQ